MDCLSSSSHNSQYPIKSFNMGCTTCSQRGKIIIPYQSVRNNIKYPSKAKLQIKQKDQTGRQIGISTVSFDFTKPFLFSAETLNLPYASHISRCVLPGIDPRGERDKKCQDYCLYISNQKSILLALFDGHGKEGEKIVSSCAGVVEGFFKGNIENYLESPEKFLEDLCNNCDANVKKVGNGIDSTNSGR